jgi:hypothetical protein
MRALQHRAEQYKKAIGLVTLMTLMQVKDSPEATKRSFLDRKGLTTAEVEEAFRRVPSEQQQGAPVSTTTTAPVQGPSGLVTYQQQPQEQQQQQQGAHHHGGVLLPAQPPQPPLQEPIRWSQVRFLVASSFLPILHSLTRPLVFSCQNHLSYKS